MTRPRAHPPPITRPPPTAGFSIGITDGNVGGTIARGTWASTRSRPFDHSRTRSRGIDQRRGSGHGPRPLCRCDGRTERDGQHKPSTQPHKAAGQTRLGSQLKGLVAHLGNPLPGMTNEFPDGIAAESTRPTSRASVHRLAWGVDVFSVSFRRSVSVLYDGYPGRDGSHRLFSTVRLSDLIPQRKTLAMEVARRTRECWGRMIQRAPRDVVPWSAIESRASP